jgi:hypothetical protein
MARKAVVACKMAMILPAAGGASGRGAAQPAAPGLGDLTTQEVQQIQAIVDQGLQGQLPSVDPATGLIPGTHNGFLGPAIRFEPGCSPRFIPQKQ